jgi:epoxyqueuosine reductase
MGDLAINCAYALTDSVREEARRLGFFKMGVARPGPLPAVDRFDNWLLQGMHGEMQYLQRQAPKRKDPGLLLPDVRSILVLALNYFPGDILTDDPLRGRISRYACGTDYHRILLTRLEELLAFVRSRQSEARGLCYVDTGPIAEKVWGAQTSLGWMGKHSNLIDPKQGSWFFLGMMLLNLELGYDEAMPDRCGTCSRCLEACPTGAIVAPYVVDARLCISYLTIEHRGPIPRRLRPLIGNRIFGCDDCQEVCPWNRFASQSGEDGLRPRRENIVPELVGLVHVTADEFKRRFERSPIRRTGRDGFVRNVVVALGNSGAPAAVPALARTLTDESPLVRGHAAWALRRISGDEAERALDQARRLENHPEVLEELGVGQGQ